MSNDEGGSIGTEPEDRGCYLFGRSHPANRLLRDDSLFAFGGAACESLHHWCRDDTGTHGVDPIICWSVVERRRFREADNAKFGGRISGLALEALHTGTGGRVHNRPAA